MMKDDAGASDSLRSDRADERTAKEETSRVSTIVEGLKGSLNKILERVERYNLPQEQDAYDPTEDLEWHWKEKDPAENQATRPPPDESVRFPTIWAFEVFPPAHSARIRDSAEALGWVGDERHMNPFFPEMVEAYRGSVLSRGAWLNLGYIVGPDAPNWMGNRTAELPPGVRAIRAAILQVLPSTTLLICQFYLGEDLAYSVDKALREDYTTEAERISPRTWRLYTAQTLKKRAVEVRREYLRDLCSQWLTRWFSGYFASSEIRNRPPTCELILLNKHRPYERMNPGAGLSSYLGLLDLSFDVHAWRSTEIAGLHLQLAEEAESDPGRLVLAGRTTETLSDDDLEPLGGGNEDREEKVVRWTDSLDQTLGRWVLYELARTYAEELAQLRDESATVDVSQPGQAVDQLRDLDKRLIALESGAIPFAEEVSGLCEDEDQFALSTYEFSRTSDFWEGRGKSLNELLRGAIKRLAHSILSTVDQIRRTADHSSHLASGISAHRLARTNTRVGKWTLIVTVIILLLTILSLIQPRWLGNLRSPEPASETEGRQRLGSPRFWARPYTLPYTPEENPKASYRL